MKPFNFIFFLASSSTNQPAGSHLTHLFVHSMFSLIFMPFRFVFIILLLLINISVQYSISETKYLKTICRGPQGIACHCQLTLLPLDVQDIVITITSCSRKGGWSSWSHWSSCLKGQQKRRRTCTRPTPIGLGSHCLGSNTEKRRCFDGYSSIPEFFWGSWSPWNEWGECDCRSSTKMRTRFCLGKSCEGCSFEYSSCNPSCPLARVQSDWSKWHYFGSAEHRFRCLSITNYPNISSEIIEEIREAPRPIWTEWEIRRGVALRYQNSTRCRVETQLLALTNSSYKVHTFWLVFSCFISLFLGFVAQSCVLYCFSCRSYRKVY